jgi:hypothetical protein
MALATLLSDGVANAVNDDFIGGRSVKNQVGVWIGNKAAKVALASRLTAPGLCSEIINRGLKPSFDILPALR